MKSLKYEKKIEGAGPSFKSILEKKNQVTGWTNLEDIEDVDRFLDCRNILLEEDLIIQKGKVKYKFKNGLTEEMIINFLNGN